MEQIGFGLIGAGVIGRVHARNVAARADAQLRWIVDIDPGRGGELAAAYGARFTASVDEMLADPAVQVVMIGSSTDVHEAHLLACVRAGKALLCEKPIADSLERARNCLDAARAANTIAAVGFNRRFDPQHLAVHDRVRAGEIGTVESIHIVSRAADAPQPAAAQRAGGMLREKGTHHYDLAYWLAHSEPVEIYAAGGCLFDPGFATYGDVDTAALTHQQLLRSMDALMDHQSAVDGVVAGLLRPLVDQDMSLVFYDLTTIRAAGLSEQQDDVRQFGMSKEGMIARQFMLGVVQTAEGLPIYHEVFDGNQAEGPTLLPTLRKVLDRFPHIRRLIVVADRGLLSLDNLEELGKISLPNSANAQALEFILAVPGRRYSEFTDVLQAIQSRASTAQREIIEEARWQGLRLVVAHHPQRAAEQTLLRNERIAALQEQAQQWASKLDGQDAGVKGKGRKLSDSGAKARLYHAVCEAHLAKIIKVDLKGALFAYTVDEAAKAQAELMDGKLLLVTNVPDLTPQEVVSRYKALADIERGFRVLKSEIDIAPVYHRLPQRIRAHAMLCFMALILHRVMRQRLKLAKSELSPDQALAQLRRIQRHSVSINRAAPMVGVSTVNTEQAQVLAAFKVKKPDANAQMPLL